MTERKLPSKHSTCRLFKGAVSLKYRYDRLKQDFQKKVESLFGEYANKEVVGTFPVPVPPPATTPTYAAFPEPATPPGRDAGGRTAVAQHGLEASGSNHTSNHTSTHTSEYFDAKNRPEYLLQHQLTDYSDFEALLRNRKQRGSEHAQLGSELSPHGYERPPYRFEHGQDGFEHSPHGFERPEFASEYPQPGFELSPEGIEQPHHHGSEQPPYEFDHSQHGVEHSEHGFRQPPYEFDHSQHGFEQPPYEFDHSQHGVQLSQHGFERPHPGLDEQLAGSFGNMLLNTPTASHSQLHPNPWEDDNPVDPVSVHHHADSSATKFYSGELDPFGLHQQGSDAVAAAESQATLTAYGGVTGSGLSVMTGETGESWESLMDTAGTSTTTTATAPFILPPVAEERPLSFLGTPFYSFYVEIRRIARGDEVAFESARRGRGIRVLGRAFCYALRLRTKTVISRRWKNARRKRIREPPRLHIHKRWTKRMRRTVPPTPSSPPGVSTHSTTERDYKGVTPRNGKWYAETRVSTCKEKLWIGTYSTQRETALALDAGHFHCTEKRKTFHFPQFVDQLGESQYATVRELCNAGRKKDATSLVKSLAIAHAAAFCGVV